MSESHVVGHTGQDDQLNEGEYMSAIHKDMGIPIAEEQFYSNIYFKSLKLHLNKHPN